MPHTSYRLTAEGQGRPGFVKGSAAITLRADGATTIVDVAGTVQTGGPIARLGQRLIGGVSKMMLDRFFGVDGRNRAWAYDRAIAADSARRANTGTIARRYSALAWMSALTSPSSCPGQLRRARRSSPFDSGWPASARSTSARRRACDVAPVTPMRADTMAPPLTSSAAATPTMA